MSILLFKKGDRDDRLTKMFTVYSIYFRIIYHILIWLNNFIFFEIVDSFVFVPCWILCPNVIWIKIDFNVFSIKQLKAHYTEK